MIDLSNIEKQIKSDEDEFPKLRQNIGKKILWAGKSSHKTPLGIVLILVFLANRVKRSPVLKEVAKS